MMKIVYCNNTDFKLRQHQKAIRKAVCLTIKEEGLRDQFEVFISFVTNDEIKNLNKVYRGKETKTDVLSFPNIVLCTATLSEMKKDELEEYRDIETGLISLGDVIIAPDVIRGQAKEFRNTFEKELMLMIIHSILHLLGYDHIKEAYKKQMFAKQKQILKKWECE